MVAFRMAVAPIEGFDQRRIVPILDIVVLAVVYLHLNGITMVVDQEKNDRSLKRTICETSCAVTWNEPSPTKAMTFRFGAPRA